ncbi:MAG: radical SAM protein [Chloroflexota bacterium]|nr:radical SAM protein [Chloroflexota bacterium]
MALDVLYIHPAKQKVETRYDKYISSPPYLLMPVGVIGLANLLREQGLRVKGLNLPLELILEPAFNLRAWLEVQEPQRLVMIDLHWYEHSFGALDVARLCKEVYPEVPVLLGGITASIFAHEILEHFPQVDLIIRGDAEEPLQQIMAGESLASIPNLAYRDGDSIVENDLAYCATLKELDRLDFVDTDFLEHRDSYASMQYSGAGIIRDASRRGHWLSIGRGCMFNCSFCGGGKAAHSQFAGRKELILRSVERVIEDIERLQRRSIHQVSFSLDPAIVGPEYWRPLLEGLQQRKVRLGLYNEFFQLPSDGFLQLFTETADLSHTEAAITVLSGDESVRRLNGKFFSNRRLFHVLSWLRRHQIPIFVYFSTNLPGETE